jgi:hypothetical protein
MGMFVRLISFILQFVLISSFECPKVYISSNVRHNSDCRSNKGYLCKPPRQISFDTSLKSGLQELQGLQGLQGLQTLQTSILLSTDIVKEHNIGEL